MEIMKLDAEQYAGQKFTLRYMTNGYYDIRQTDLGFQIVYECFEKPTEMSFDDYMFNEWLEDPVAHGAFENGQLLGYVEGIHEKWNNRYRISNICIFDDAHRHSNIGTALMNTILHDAKESGARMVVLKHRLAMKMRLPFTARMGLKLLASICSPTQTQTRNGTKSELRWESNYESETYNYGKQLPQWVLPSRR